MILLIYITYLTGFYYCYYCSSLLFALLMAFSIDDILDVEDSLLFVWDTFDCDVFNRSFKELETALLEDVDGIILLML